MPQILGRYFHMYIMYAYISILTDCQCIKSKPEIMSENKRTKSEITLKWLKSFIGILYDVTKDRLIISYSNVILSFLSSRWMKILWDYYNELSPTCTKNNIFGIGWLFTKTPYVRFIKW